MDTHSGLEFPPEQDRKRPVATVAAVDTLQRANHVSPPGRWRLGHTARVPNSSWAARFRPHRLIR